MRGLGSSTASLDCRCRVPRVEAAGLRLSERGEPPAGVAGGKRRASRLASPTIWPSASCASPYREDVIVDRRLFSAGLGGNFKVHMRDCRNPCVLRNALQFIPFSGSLGIASGG